MPKIKKIVDLSHALMEQTPVYPGDPVPHFWLPPPSRRKAITCLMFFLGSQTGSHVDVPYHFSNQGATVDKMDLIYFMGNGLIMDVTHKKEKEEITLEEIKRYEETIEAVDIVLFKTNWYKKAGADEFYDHPFLSKAGGNTCYQKVLRQSVSMPFILDHTGGTQFPIHDMESVAGGIIVENLANLDVVEFDSPVYYFFCPAKLIGCDGSPVRAVAVDFY